MSAAENKELIRGYFAAIDAGCQEGNSGIVEDFLAPDFVEHNPFPGLPPTRDGWKQAFEHFAATAPGRHVIEELIAEDDMVVGRVTAYGRHTGDLFGIPATGKEFQVTGIAMWRVRDGKIVEHWHQTDQVGLMQQIGKPAA
jgi:predicted ester cyclase